MAYSRVCAADELGAGDMAAFFLDGWEVLVVRDANGELHAMDGACPHEDFPLIHGDFDGTVLVCANHLWCFDATTGKGINPPTCQLSQYAVKTEAGEVFVDPDQAPGAADG
jgi:toluene monooxygenase system ferredoxin subunit